MTGSGGRYRSHGTVGVLGASCTTNRRVGRNAAASAAAAALLRVPLPLLYDRSTRSTCLDADRCRSSRSTAAHPPSGVMTEAAHGGARYDALIIGGGHNGLVCAAYLAATGLRVIVLERRAIVGGAAVTEEFHPGFRNSVASYTVSLLNPKVIRDLDLHAHGLKIVERDIANFLPTQDGRYLSIGAGRTKEEVAKFSRKDADLLDVYGERLEVIADLFRELVLETPPNVVEGGWRVALPEMLHAAQIAGRFSKLNLATRQELLTLFASSAGDYLDGL